MCLCVLTEHLSLLNCMDMGSSYVLLGQKNLQIFFLPPGTRQFTGFQLFKHSGSNFQWKLLVFAIIKHTNRVRPPQHIVRHQWQSFLKKYFILCTFSKMTQTTSDVLLFSASTWYSVLLLSSHSKKEDKCSWNKNKFAFFHNLLHVMKKHR